MINRFIAVVAAFVVPFAIFILVIGLNESDIERDVAKDSAANFDVERKRQINKPKPKPKPKPKKREQAQKLPSVKPANVGANLSGSGLSFGVPQFDEAEFAELQSDDLLAGTTDQAMDKSTVDTPQK